MPDEIIKELEKFFRKQHVLELGQIKKYFHGRSDRSVWRDLKAVAALSSYSHAGRYHTLPSIARFDARGLWHYRDIGFSEHETLRATIEHWVNSSQAGHTYVELKQHFVVRIENVLPELVAHKRIGRAGIAREYVYVSADKKLGGAQLARRQEQGRIEKSVVSERVIIEVLAEVIRGSRICVEVEELSERLKQRGIEVPQAQVALILDTYGVKKTLGLKS